MSAIRPLLRTAKVSIPKRTLATPVNGGLYTNVLPPKIPAALHLQSGQSYEGSSFGSQNSKFGETVFSTSITSCEYSLLHSLAIGSDSVLTTVQTQTR